ncbi:Pimeloyl-ACP methyl ester carboxylesterase [Klenkia soli]|uniref:Pimeloyl-ACP methyl ester carboxylesterase n=1 Tax=Klenkia soli TaxID=1052260 RepID=A0A1H0L1G2_9ACTN|nr:alpha/beta hydrolase [Klenkia soli]SDO62068.1 Pimeloyl-ACP methyl ester carboxylesterase [Klenkia soli]
MHAEEHGAGEPVLLLHGGFCTIETMRPQADALAADFRVHAFERPGHGRTPDVDGPYSYAAETARTLAWLDDVGLGRVHVVGHSDGAIIGLLLALQHPERVRSLVAISANLHPSGFTFSPEELAAALSTAGVPVAVDPDDEDTRAHARLSPDGPDHAGVVLAKLRRLWLTEPDIDPADLARITAPALVVAADRDTVRLEHTVLIARSIPGAQLAVVPGATHALVTEQHEVVTGLLQRFLRGVSGTARSTS